MSNQDLIDLTRDLGIDLWNIKIYDDAAIMKIIEMLGLVGEDQDLINDVISMGQDIWNVRTLNSIALGKAAAFIQKLKEPPPPMESDWKVRIAGDGTEQYKHKDETEWLVAGSLGAIYMVLGGDHNSTSARNRPLLMKPGEVMEIMPGNYTHFRLTRSYEPEDLPLTLKASVPGTVYILPNPVGGSQTHYVEWGGACERYDIDFIGDDSRAVGTENPSSSRWDGRHPGFLQQRFYNCAIIGGYNAETDLGPKNKWGCLTYEVGLSNDGKPGWIWSGGNVEGIKREHAFYMHNTQGDSLYENFNIKWCGRSGFQFTARPGEGLAGKGNVVIRNITGEDCAFDGPHFINCKGRHDGDFLIENVTYTAGHNPDLHQSNQGRVTGFLVVHDGSDTGEPTRKVTVKDCTADLIDPDRSIIDVADCTTFELLNTKIIVDQPHKIALRIDKSSVPNITIDRTCDVLGKISYGGVKYQDWAEFIAFAETDPQITLV